MSESSPNPESATLATPDSEGLRCDFCGDVVGRVRRIALDHDYERLQSRHVVRYACESCSDEKERKRIGLSRSGDTAG